MPRSVRIDLPAGWYHVTARGNERRAIFRDDRDREYFLLLIGRMTQTYGFRLHAYVLMGNHFHPMIETLSPNLSRAMQWLNGSYGVWFNKRHERVGHLFQTGGQPGSCLHISQMKTHSLLKRPLSYSNSITRPR